MARGFTTILIACLVIFGMAVALFSGFTVMVNISPLNLISLTLGIVGIIVGIGLIAVASYLLNKT